MTLVSEFTYGDEDEDEEGEDMDKDILKNINSAINIDKDILENINIDKDILRSISMLAILDVSTGHIFILDFWTILVESKAYILSLSLTAANWGKFLKHWHAFEVSLSLFWNTSNVFS